MVINAVPLPGVTNANDVRAGSVIKAVYLEYWITSDSSTVFGTFNITVEKKGQGATAMSFGQSVNLMAYPNKKNILYTTQGIIGKDVNNAVPILKQWIAIPKGKQRFGNDDELVVNFSAITQTQNVCGIAIYKEYY